MNLEQYRNMTVAEATNAARLAGFEVAIEVADGPQILNSEYRQGRVNFRVENGVVVGAHIG
jgi:hypothetical protein